MYSERRNGRNEKWAEMKGGGREKKDLHALCLWDQVLERGWASRIHPLWGSIDADGIAPWWVCSTGLKAALRWVTPAALLWIDLPSETLKPFSIPGCGWRQQRCETTACTRAGWAGMWGGARAGWCWLLPGPCGKGPDSKWTESSPWGLTDFSPSNRC